MLEVYRKFTEVYRRVTEAGRYSRCKGSLRYEQAIAGGLLSVHSCLWPGGSNRLLHQSHSFQEISLERCLKLECQYRKLL